jgi:hypothetical protein
MGALGFEQAAKAAENTKPDAKAAQIPAHSLHGSQSSDMPEGKELDELIAKWSALTATQRQAVMAIVRGA